MFFFSDKARAREILFFEVITILLLIEEPERLAKNKKSTNTFRLKCAPLHDRYWHSSQTARKQ